MSKTFTYTKKRIDNIILDHYKFKDEKNDLEDDYLFSYLPNYFSHPDLKKIRLYNEPYILELIADLPNEQVNGYSGCKLLLCAVMCNHAKVVKYLLDNYKNINDDRENGKKQFKGYLSPAILIMAIEGNRYDILKMLIEYPKININLPNSCFILVPIIQIIITDYLTEENKIKMLKILLNHPSFDINCKYIDDAYIEEPVRTPIEFARAREYNEIVNFLENYQINKID